MKESYMHRNGPRIFVGIVGIVLMFCAVLSHNMSLPGFLNSAPPLWLIGFGVLIAWGILALFKFGGF